MRFLFLIATLFIAATQTANDNRLYRVSLVSSANPDVTAYAKCEGRYAYTLENIPGSALKGNSELRTVIFGDQVLLKWEGCVKEASYQVDLTFVSDSATRSVKILTNKTVLVEKLILPEAEILMKSLKIPPNAYADGSLNLTIISLSGPNAVLSMVEVFSDFPDKLKAPAIQREAYPRIPKSPRLSPLPEIVRGVKQTKLSLNGQWRFHAGPLKDLSSRTRQNTADWNKIQVPGEWVMQGFTVEAGAYAGYFREFIIPSDWTEKRIKLRFDNVYSICEIWVNNQLVGAHHGGFLPFELDITSAVRKGDNTLALSVCNESTMDTLATGSKYAAHQLGGVVRKVSLFALPVVNIGAQNIATRFDEIFKNASLDVSLNLVNESNEEFHDVLVSFLLTDPSGEPVSMHSDRITISSIHGNKALNLSTSITVEEPLKWDTEHPNLYRLRTRLLIKDRMIEEVSSVVGFRQVEVRGKQVFVNNIPIKLRGVNRHETHPLLGRSLNQALWRKDAELYRAANCNYIRNSHYPPAEEFLSACDELGLFVECEAPLCWVKHGANPVWL